MAKLWGLRPRAFLNALQQGKFDRLLKDHAEDWFNFLRRAARIPWNERVVLCLRRNDSETGAESRVWVAYEITSVTQEDLSVRLEFIAFPGEEPSSWIAPPEELEDVPTFFYPPEAGGKH